MKNESMKAKLSYILAMAAFGTIGLFVRNIALSSGEIALYRAVIALVVLYGYQLIKGQPVRLRGLGRDALLLFLSGAAMGFNWILLFTAYRYTSVSIATLSYYFAPVIVTLGSAILFHERLTTMQIICFLFSMFGLMLITGAVSGGGNDLIGILFGLGAAALYATVVLLNKFIQKVSGLDRTILQFAAAAIVLVPYVAATSGFHLLSAGRSGILNLSIVGVIHTGVMYCLFFSALKQLPGQEAAILSYIDPLVAVIVSVLLLSEPLTAMQLAGGIILLAGTLSNELFVAKRQNCCGDC